MLKGLILLLSTAMLGGVALPAWAQSEGQSSIKVEDAKEEKSVNKVAPKGGDVDVDELITNNKLRAESGSKSRVSVASTLGYNGGTLSHPFGDIRPNIAGATGDTAFTDVEGGVNIKINITQRDSILLGETVRYITPQSSLKAAPKGYIGKKFDSYDPQLNYQRIYNVNGLQSYFQVGPGFVTRSNLTRIGYLGNFGIYNVNAYQIGKSRATVGVESAAGFAWYRKPQAYPQLGYSEQDVRENESDYNVAAYPYFEYQITDKINFRTVGLWFSLEHTLANSSPNVWHKDTALQSVGVGISVTRDIFVYPNLQFVPDHTISWNRTNFAVATDINLF